jgi:hypothetical protein
MDSIGHNSFDHTENAKDRIYGMSFTYIQCLDMQRHAKAVDSPYAPLRLGRWDKAYYRCPVGLFLPIGTHLGFVRGGDFDIHSLQAIRHYRRSNSVSHKLFPPLSLRPLPDGRARGRDNRISLRGFGILFNQAFIRKKGVEMTTPFSY